MGANKEHEYCLRCGRKLKNPAARARGYGPICEKKLQHEKSRQLFAAGNRKEELL